MTKPAQPARFTPYDSDEEVRSLGRRLLDCTLPKSEWTHYAHCTAAVYLLRDRPDLDLAEEMPKIIRRYNEATGGVNSDSEGYHETITQFYLKAIRAALARLPAGITLWEACKRIIGSPFGERAFPLTFYSRERLFSVDARRYCVEPDLKSFDFGQIAL